MIYYIKSREDEGYFPWLENYTEEEAKEIRSLWKKQNPNRYIEDPLSGDQCLAYMYDELPFWQKMKFKVKYVRNKKDEFKKKMDEN